MPGVSEVIQLLVKECLDLIDNSLLLRCTLATASATVLFGVNELARVQQRHFEVPGCSAVFDERHGHVLVELVR